MKKMRFVLVGFPMIFLVSCGNYFHVATEFSEPSIPIPLALLGNWSVEQGESFLGPVGGEDATKASGQKRSCRVSSLNDLEALLTIRKLSKSKEGEQSETVYSGVAKCYQVERFKIIEMTILHYLVDGEPKSLDKEKGGKLVFAVEKIDPHIPAAFGYMIETSASGEDLILNEDEVLSYLESVSTEWFSFFGGVEDGLLLRLGEQPESKFESLVTTFSSQNLLGIREASSSSPVYSVVDEKALSDEENKELSRKNWLDFEEKIYPLAAAFYEWVQRSPAATSYDKFYSEYLSSRPMDLIFTLGGFEHLLEIQTTSELTEVSSEVNFVFKGMVFAQIPWRGKRISLSRFETTCAAFETFVTESQFGVSHPWKFVDSEFQILNRNGFPVVQVTHSEAVLYCEWLTMKAREEGEIGIRDQFRLPTSLEWKAAALEPGQEWWSGSTWDAAALNGNFSGAESEDKEKLEGFRDANPRLAPIAIYNPNSFGLFDMGGNVWEWCQDGPDEEQAWLHGGAWDTSEKKMMRRDYRISADKSKRSGSYGFRVVLEVAQ